MSKKVRYLAAFLALAMVMAAGCSQSDRGSRDKDEEEEEVEEEETSEETEEPSETTVETSEETTVSSETTETEPTSDQDTSATIDISEHYDLFTGFAAGEYESDPGAEFAFVNNYQEGDLSWMLAVKYTDGSLVIYKKDGSEVVAALPADLSVNTEYFAEESVVPYEMFKDYPCILDMDLYGGPYAVSGSIPDGYYYGNLLALSMDGNYALIQYGEGVIYTEDEYNALQVGDTVTYPGWDGEEGTATVTSIDEDGWMHLDQDDLYFVQGAYTPDPTQYCLLSSSDNPVYSNEGIALVPISDDCVVTDTFGMLYTDLEWADYNLQPKTGEPLLDSFYFYLETHVPYVPHYVSNGWMETYGLLYPVEVTDGQITVLNIEWR